MYNNTNKGALFLADKVTSKGDKYYNGKINIKGVEHNITMFENESENPKAPKFRLVVNEFKKEDVKPQDFAKEDPYENFGININLEEKTSDLPF